MHADADLLCAQHAGLQRAAAVGQEAVGFGQPRKQVLVGVVVVQRLLYLQRQCVLAFDLVGIIRVHDAQQGAQARQGARLAHARQLARSTNQVAGLLQQRLPAMLTRSSGSIWDGAS